MTRSLRLCTALVLFAFPAFAADSTTSPCSNPTVPQLTEIYAGSGRSLGKPAILKQKSDIPAPAHLGQWLTLRGCNFQNLKFTAEKPLQLYLNGLPLAGSTPDLLYTGGKVSGVRFELVRTEESKDTWAALLGRPKVRPVAVDVSLGLKGCGVDCTAMTDPAQIRLVVLRWRWFWSYTILMLLLLIVLVQLARTTGMLRDHGPGSPWSLARTQMAWWTFFVVCAFLFIWMVSGSYSSLSNSVLALIGISTGTAFLGAVIDDTKQNQAQQRAALETEKQALQSRAPELAPAEVQRLADLDRQIQGLPDLVRQTPRSFLYDILSDEDGVSFHRFQMVIWTIVLTSIFVIRVYSTLAMPEFDAALLGLTGISAGTYLGFKFPEKKA